MADPLIADAPPSQTQPQTADLDSSFSIPSLDSFGPQYLTGKDDVAGGDQNDAISLGDLEFDFSFNDVCLHFSDDFPNPSQSLHSDVQPGPDPCFHQVPNFDKFPHAVFKSSPEMRHLSGDADQSLNHSLNGSAVLTSESPEMDANQISGYLNVASPESNGSNRGSSEICVDDKGLNCPSPGSQVSGNCASNDAMYLENCVVRSVSFSPNSNSNSDSDNISIRVGVVDQKIKLENSANKHNVVNSSLLKRKKEAEDSTNDNGLLRISKYIKSTCNLSKNISSDIVGGLSEEEEKRKTRLMRNRESAQLSRQRKKHYVEELEDKVRNMHSTIQDLNAKVSYFMSENATLRQQVGSGGSGATPSLQLAPPPPGMYPHPAMMYPWMHCAPPYMMKGSQVPLVPIPKLKPQQATQSPILSKKVESNKKEGPKTKKVAGVSFLGLLFFIVMFGGLVPIFNVRYGGVNEAVSGGKHYVGDGFHEMNRGRVLMVNGTETYGGERKFDDNNSVHCDHSSGGKPRVGKFGCMRNGSEPLTASLYVPRNDKLVKIDGNLIIHSVLASEKAMTSNEKGNGETGLAVAGGLSPVAGSAKNSGRHPHLRALDSSSTDKDNLKSTATDGKLQQWFREGLAGPMLSSGMCTEVFQFDVSSAIVPAAATRNISQNSTRPRNRRILRGITVPLPLNISNKEHYTAGNSQKEKNSSSMVVSVLVDPREIGDGDADNVMGTKSLSRIFVVVLIDSVKYVTYSCMLPFMGSAPVVTA